MIVEHIKPAGWVDTGEAGKIQPSEVASMAHAVSLTPEDIALLTGPQGPQGLPGADGAPGAQGPQGLPGPSILPDGNMVFSGVRQRIKGDFSGAEFGNRLMFQTSVIDGVTAVGAIPSGAGVWAQFEVNNASDPTNASRLALQINSSEAVLRSTINGSGVFLPLVAYVGGKDRMRIGITGLVELRNSEGFGYGVGSGGEVKQVGSKSAAVTLNKAAGRVYLSDSALGAGESKVFNVNNSLFLEYDVAVVQAVGGYSLNYRVEAIYATNGAFVVRVTNITAGSLSEGLAINFAIIKGSVT